jgi:uncharacterized protein YbjT (DUF2867 family)
MNTVGVFGATGNIGQCLLPVLASEPGIDDIRIITNRPERIESEVKLGKANGKRIVVNKGDYCVDEATVLETLRGCSRLFVILPQSLSSKEIIERGKFIADCAVASNVDSIVRISSLGIDGQSIKFVGSQGPLGDAHVVVEKYCAEIGLKQVSLRPTSLFSNINFNVQEIGSTSTISTPLGTVARVNWVSCDDVARVAAKVLAATEWDQFGKIIDVTGPRENTLSAEEMAQTISASVGKSVKYKETDVPPVPDYAGLWKFLRRGGYDCHSGNAERITGKQGQRFSDINFF